MDNRNGHRVDTQKLIDRLKSAKSLKTFLNRNNVSIIDDSFSEYLSALCDEKDMNRADIIARSGIDRTYAYQIFRGIREPSRDKVIQLAIGMKLGFDETQKLLRAARKSLLYPRIKRDAVIIFAIEKSLSYDEIQQMLYDVNEKALGTISDT